MGSYRSDPSRHDALRSARRFFDPNDRPKASHAVTQDEHFILCARALQFQRRRHALFGDWYILHKCPFCSVNLLQQTLPSEHPAIMDCHRGVCPSCGWWETDQRLYPDETTGISIHRRALLLELSLSGIDAPVDALCRHVMRHPDDLSRISPKKLEELTAYVFRDFMDCEVMHVGGPGDGGIDVLLIQGAARYAIQVKRRLSLKTAEPVRSIREFIGAMVLSGIPRGIFVTSAPRFSKAAIAAGEKAIDKGAAEYIELADASRLIDLCCSTGAKSEKQIHLFSASDDLFDHVNAGYERYIEIAVGNDDWRMDPNSPPRSKETNERANQILFEG